MHHLHRDRGGQPGRPRPRAPLPRRARVNPVLALQRTIGNRGTAQVLAREKGKNRGSFEHSVKIGKLGPIQITGGNVAEWAAKKDPDGLKIISPKGKHSNELKRLFDGKTKIDVVETASVVGENTLVTIKFGRCRITRYAQNGDKDEWTVDFETANRQTLSIGAAR